MSNNTNEWIIRDKQSKHRHGSQSYPTKAAADAAIQQVITESTAKPTPLLESVQRLEE
jgi:hypothetical protein